LTDTNTPELDELEPTDPEIDELDAEIEQREAARAKRKAATEKARKRQRVTDLDKIAELEAQYGDTNVTALNVPYFDGLPTMVAVRTPTDPEMKRYRHRLVMSRKPGVEADPKAGITAAEELADVCRIYPGDDEYERLRMARPGIHLQLGNAASKLSTASAETEGKA